MQIVPAAAYSAVRRAASLPVGEQKQTRREAQYRRERALQQLCAQIPVYAQPRVLHHACHLRRHAHAAEREQERAQCKRTYARQRRVCK